MHLTVSKQNLKKHSLPVKYMNIKQCWTFPWQVTWFDKKVTSAESLL